MRPLILLFILILGLGLGCDKKSDPNQPPIIHLGRDRCSECSMIFSEERFAAVLQLQDGQTLKFDDMKCLLHYLNRSKVPYTRIWIRDYETENWVDAGKAFLVFSKEVITPMGSGIVAFSREDFAKKLAAAEHTEILNFKSLEQKGEFQ